jgi:hypothetical protein
MERLSEIILVFPSAFLVAMMVEIVIAVFNRALLVRIAVEIAAVGPAAVSGWPSSIIVVFIVLTFPMARRGEIILITVPMMMSHASVPGKIVTINTLAWLSTIATALW